MNSKIIAKSILLHLAVFFFTMFLSSQVVATFNGYLILEVIHFIIITCLYIGSGYMIAKKEITGSTLSYFSVFILGFTIWAIAFLSSPYDLNWKFGKGGIWLFYRLYVISYDMPLGRLISFENVQINMALLLTLSILPSVFMIIGKKIYERKTLPNIC